MDRRKFLALSSAAATKLVLPLEASTTSLALAFDSANTTIAPSYASANSQSMEPQPDAPQPHPPIKAILFDGFAIFDPRPVATLAAQLFPEKGASLIKEWRTRQFEYTWLRSMSNNYADFFTITRQALVFAANMLGLEINGMQQDQLMDEYYRLQPWPGIPELLKKLKTAGYRLGILSNFTPKMLSVNVSNGHLEGVFEYLISVDTVKRYKPAPETYRLGMDICHLTKKEILFVPFAGWDTAGAKTFGYTTFWLNYLQAPMEELDVEPDATGKTTKDLWIYLDTSTDQ